jgi:hypothetical protein
MSAARKLQPLAGYLSNEAVDINKAGQNLGNSSDHSQSSFAPPSPATLWGGNTISSYRKPEPEILMLLMLAVNGEMNQADLTAVHEESPLTELMNAGLVGQWGGGRTFALTARGKAYVEMICRVPLPEKKEVWIDPRDGEQYG